MKRRELHLINANGDPVSSAIRSAVEATFDYSVAERPEIDRAILANMAEQLAVSMEKNKESILLFAVMLTLPCEARFTTG